MTKSQRVAIYARFSTDMQNPKSAEDQERECRKHAEREGWSVEQVFQDTALSGATKGRPGYEALLSAVKARQFDIVLFEHLDRLGRDLEFLMGFYKEARHADCELHQLHQGKLGIFDIGILGTFAQIFLEELSYKTRRGLVGKIKAGKSAGGLSYGYCARRTGAGDAIKGEQDIDTNEAPIVERIFREYAAGKSPIHIAADLNADGIAAPRGRGNGSGHWRQTTINGNRERGTGILNNELYIGRRVWNRQRYSKHPETGKRVPRPNPPKDWIIHEVPDLRIIEQSLWDAVKERQAAQQRARNGKNSTDPNGLSVAQNMRRRKYLLSGLLSCGQCGGNLTIAGSGKARRYYCANAKEKGASICAGMPGLKEQDAATSILSGLKTGLMQDEAYAEFRARFLARTEVEEKERGQMLCLHDQNVRQLETRHANLMKAVEDGDYSAPIIAQLNKVDAELAEVRAKREALTSEPIVLPTDLPALYRAYVDDLVATLSDEEVSGRASEELHSLIDTVVVGWDGDERHHLLELRGKRKRRLEGTGLST
ncbi:recombinase family protein [Thalassorhabdomicrobium marinisediminis]|uniref:recombinase family protein n=1 Tax=Thalassorhabdomicrobium marinisediminis TaxID=2170577 RepID=UPI002493BFD9|nr:recombinase family protein [Thalassorhabdomicrobium marinisediminis]